MFNPIIKPFTICVVLTLTVHFDWYIRQLDVPNVFLHGHLMENVFMEQPQYFVEASHLDFVYHYSRLSMAINKHLRHSLLNFLRHCLILDFLHLKWIHIFSSIIVLMQLYMF
jgi:hypothetical protein